MAEECAITPKPAKKSHKLISLVRQLQKRTDMPLLKKKRNPFEASMVIDNPDVKVVEGRFNEKPFFIAIGTSEQREVKGSGELTLPIGAKGEYASQKYLKWNILYNPKTLPDFVPIDKVKEFMTSTVAVTGSTVDVLTTQPVFRETASKELNKIENRMAKSANIQGAEILDANMLDYLREKSYEEIMRKTEKRKPKARKRPKPT